ncbi:alpha/beta hydrolase [Sandaracinobacter sp. RS1-74]|uniref:alpha/beta fold hydrolase n=1 Tax=Sandaracinobacteroides sayramensis TaxID=2913411 RepID=UPI001EDB270A|nr:alpha/beta hydrolase [Sandaracinobacteroides sayramensis]MCG2840618.1 alpha/beta hydrolase [Sandaracinobacteroides sayramensis]
MTDAAVAFVERRWTAADGSSLFARDYPAAAGPARLPVVLIHGLTRNSGDFEDVAPWIAAGGRRVLAVDVRGRGRSEWSADPMRYQLPTYAADMLAMLDALGISRAHFVGTSMGGLITLLVSARRMRAVASATLNDVGPEIDPAGIARIAGYAGKQAVIENWDDAARYVKRTSEVAFPDFTEADWLSMARRGFVEDAAGRPVLDYDPDISLPMSRRPVPNKSWLADILFRRLARRRPVLLLRGALSDILSAPIAAKMRRAAPKMVYREVPGVGHAPFLTEPAARRAIEDFLARQP